MPVATMPDLDLPLPASKPPTRATSRATSTSGSRAGTSYLFQPFGFDSKTAYDARHSLTELRSSNYERKNPAKDDDIWKRAPPDFRPQCYVPNPPKRNSRDAVRPWTYGPLTKPEKRQAAALRLPEILKPKPEEKQDFLTTGFNIPDAWEGRMLFVKEGMYRPGPYQMPKPHDFRGYPPIQSLGLPEFETDYERDPYNLNFLSSHLDILPGDGPVARETRDITGIQMAPPLPSQPQWEARLILPKDQFPNKYMAYTRFRRKDRSPHSALMDRVDDKLSAQWAKEKLERQLTIHTTHGFGPKTGHGSNGDTERVTLDSESRSSGHA